jgi:hypothetical protein
MRVVDAPAMVTMTASKISSACNRSASDRGCVETLAFIQNRRPRESGDPGTRLKSLDSRLRWNDGKSALETERRLSTQPAPKEKRERQPLDDGYLRIKLAPEAGDFVVIANQVTNPTHDSA